MTALVSGLGFGLGLLFVVRGLRPARPSLAASLAASLDRSRAVPAGGARSPRGLPGAQAGPGVGVGVGARLAAELDRPGLRLASVHEDLAIVGRPVGRFFADKALFALVGALLVPSVLAVLSLGGVVVPVVLPVWTSLVLAVVGFFLPDLLTWGEAAARRRSFRHALGAFLDLVSIALAGGAGVEAALHDAARLGQGWSFIRLREALGDARLSGATPWQALGRLGTELGVSELSELASNLTLAGTEGARVRESLAAKAVSLRRHEAAEAETRAQEASERMSLPVAVLLFGFLVFLGYPALARVLGGI